MKLPYNYQARLLVMAPAGTGQARRARSADRPTSVATSAGTYLSIAILLCGLIVGSRPVVTASATLVPSFDHVFLVVM